MAKNIEIGGRLHSVATEHIVAGANEIQDDTLNKTQAQINGEVNNTLEIHDSVIEGLNSQNYESYTATDETTDVTDVLPDLGAVNTVYRLGKWDGTQYDTTQYAEYTWINTGIDQGEYVLLDVKNYGIDDEPTAGSNNVVKSDAIHKAVNIKSNVLSFKGKGATIVYDSFNAVCIAGHTYRFWIKNPEWEIPSTEPGNTKFQIYYRETLESGTTLYTVFPNPILMNDTVQPYYDFTFPTEVGGVQKKEWFVFLGGRAAEGTNVYVVVEDLTLLNQTKEQIENVDKAKRTYQLIGINNLNNGTVKVLQDIQVTPNHSYIIRIGNPSISVENTAFSSAYSKLWIDVQNQLVVNVLKDGVISDLYKIDIPNGVDFITIGMRASEGAKQCFDLEDITFLANEVTENNINDYTKLTTKGLDSYVEGEHIAQNVLIGKRYTTLGTIVDSESCCCTLENSPILVPSNAVLATWNYGEYVQYMSVLTSNNRLPSQPIVADVQAQSGISSRTFNVVEKKYIFAAFNKNYQNAINIEFYDTNNNLISTFTPVLESFDKDGLKDWVKDEIDEKIQTDVFGKNEFTLEGEGEQSLVQFVKVKPGEIKNINISNISAFLTIDDITTITGNYQCFIVGFYKDNTYVGPSPINILIKNADTIQSDYTITIPEDADVNQLRFFVRLKTGTVCTFTLQNVLDTDKISNSSWLGLYQGSVLEDAEISKIDNVVYTSPISMASGFYLSVNDGYNVKCAHLLNIDGTIANYNEMPNHANYPSYPENQHSYRVYSSNLELPQFCVILEIQKDNNSTISPTENIIKEYSRIDTSKLVREIPTNSKMKHFQNRSRSLQQVVWSPVENMPASGSLNKFWEIYFKKGLMYHGIPYSENDEYSKFVGQHVSIRTFLTAIMFSRSVMYTEHINGSLSGSSTVTPNQSKYGIQYHGLDNTYCATYYGTVCTGYTGYMGNIPIVITSSGYSGLSFLQEIQKEESEEWSDVVNVFDYIWNSGHCSIITDIYRDEFGDIKYIAWGEQTQPRGDVTLYTKEDFNNRFISNSCKIYRYRDTSVWNNLPDAEFGLGRYVQTDMFSYPEKLNIDNDILTFAGDYAAFSIGDYTDTENNNKAYLVLHRGAGYDRLELYSADDEEMTNPIIPAIDISENITNIVEQLDIYPEDAQSQEDWIRYNLAPLFYGNSTLLQPGCYKARMVSTSDSTKKSGFTFFEMIDINFTAEIVGNTTECDFSSIEGIPYVITVENRSGLGNRYYEIQQGETSKVLNYSDYSSNKYLKIFVKGKYGVSVKRIKMSE